MKKSLVLASLALLLTVTALSAKGTIYIESIDNKETLKDGTGLIDLLDMANYEKPASIPLGTIFVSYNPGIDEDDWLRTAIYPGVKITLTPNYKMLDFSGKALDGFDKFRITQPDKKKLTSIDTKDDNYYFTVNNNELVLHTPKNLSLPNESFKNNDLQKKDWLVTIILKDSGPELIVKPK